MSGRWWRAYGRARHDPKLLKLTDKQFRWWFNLVCVASDNAGVLPPHADLAVEFRVTGKVMTEALDALVAAGLFDHDETGIHPHNWDVLQYKSDTSADRMRRLRERQRDVTSDATCDVTRPVTVTRSESETEADTEKTPAKAGGGRTPKSTKSGTRIPADWRPTDAGRSYAADRGLDPDSTAEAFIDWWSAANGPNAVKRDWDAAFRTWCRRDAVGPVGQAAARPVPPSRGGDAYLDQLALIARRADADERDRH